MAVLEDDEVDRFMEQGFIAIPGAFSAAVAGECRAGVWRELAVRGFLEGRPDTWVDPEVRVPCPEGGPFVEAGTAPQLWEAYDQLIGPGRWARRHGVGGSVVIRFPSPESIYAGGDGWHIDSWHDRDGEWWSTVHSETRGLLALFLLSDVSDDDAPTALLCGSHADAARLLASHPDGLSWWEVRPQLPPTTFDRPQVLATGRAGDVYLVHPFLVHRSTWPHRGRHARMIAQPSIRLDPPYALRDERGTAAVERCILNALAAGSAGRT